MKNGMDLYLYWFLQPDKPCICISSMLQNLLLQLLFLCWSLDSKFCHSFQTASGSRVYSKFPHPCHNSLCCSWGHACMRSMRSTVYGKPLFLFSIFLLQRLCLDILDMILLHHLWLSWYHILIEETVDWHWDNMSCSKPLVHGCKPEATKKVTLELFKYSFILPYWLKASCTWCKKSSQSDMFSPFL